jgi:hypothetical protein
VTRKKSPAGVLPSGDAFERLIYNYVVKKDRPRSLKLTDRSLKAEGNPKIAHSRKTLLELLTKSGLPGKTRSNAAFSLEEAYAYYADAAARRARYPRVGVQRAEIQELVRRTAYLLQACNYLSQPSRLAIMDSAGSLLGPDELQGTLQKFMIRAEVTLKRLPKDVGSRPKQDDLRQFLLLISAVWFAYGPTPRTKGVVIVNGECKGPLLDLTVSLLKVFHVSYQSEESLGSLLYELRARALKTAVSMRRRLRARAVAPT